MVHGQGGASILTGLQHIPGWAGWVMVRRVGWRYTVPHCGPSPKGLVSSELEEGGREGGSSACRFFLRCAHSVHRCCRRCRSSSSTTRRMLGLTLLTRSSGTELSWRWSVRR
eukprot:EG_transcript_51243